MTEDFDKKAFWEAIKLPLRLLVFATLGYLLDFLVLYFSGVDSPTGKIFTGLLIMLDKYLHETRASESKKPLKGFNRGLLPF